MSRKSPFLNPWGTFLVLEMSLFISEDSQLKVQTKQYSWDHKPNTTYIWGLSPLFPQCPKSMKWSRMPPLLLIPKPTHALTDRSHETQAPYCGELRASFTQGRQQCYLASGWSRNCCPHPAPWLVTAGIPARELNLNWLSNQGQRTIGLHWAFSYQQ